MSKSQLKVFCIVLMQFSINSMFSQTFSNQNASIYIDPSTHLKMEDVDFYNLSSTIHNDGNILVTDNGTINNSGKITGRLSLQGNVPKTVRLGALESFEQANTADVMVNANCSINKLLKLDGGTLISNGFDITLQSDSVRTCLVHHNGGITSGDFICQRWVTNDGYHYLSTPTSNATVNQLNDDINIDLSGNLPNAHYYNETSTTYDYTSRWAPIPSLTYPMTSGDGYIFRFNASTGKVIDIVGPLTNGDVSKTLTYTNSQPTPNTSPNSPEGWNLIGNPYQSPIDLDLVISNNASSILNSFYQWDPKAYLYKSYVNSISSHPDFNGTIPSMQGFFVRVNREIPSSSQITFTNSMRISDPNETISPFMRTNRKLLRLQISGHEQKNYTVVYFQEGATMDFDEAYDAYQLGSDNSIGFGSYCNDKRLSINGQPASNLSQISIPLYSDFNTPGTYEISIEEFSNFDGNSEIVLEDLLLSTTHLLNSGPYSFEGHPSDGTNRFILNAQLGTSDINILNEELTAIINKCGNALCINFNKPTTDDLNLRIFNVLGQTIFSKSLPKDIEQETIELDLPNHQAYFIELEGDKEVRKIIW